jgi:hypothetical protein
MIIVVTMCLICSDRDRYNWKFDVKGSVVCCVCHGYQASYSLIAPSDMGTGFVKVWFHCNLIDKLVRGMKSGTFLKELVSVFDLRK